MTTNTQTLPSLRQAVDQIRDQHIAAVAAGDAPAAAGLFAPDAVFLPPGQPALHGTSDIQAWFTYVFANFRLPEFVLRPDAIEEHGDLVLEHGSWQAAFQPLDGSPRLPAGGTYLTVYARLRDGSVRMIRDTFNGMPG